MDSLKRIKDLTRLELVELVGSRNAENQELRDKKYQLSVELESTKQQLERMTQSNQYHAEQTVRSQGYVAGMLDLLAAYGHKVPSHVNVSGRDNFTVASEGCVEKRTGY